MQGFSIDSTDKSGGLYHQEIIGQLSGASLIDGRFLFEMVGSDAPYN
ncbi:MAG: hypothetical protein HC789_21025 [Microcoleus sp. CSU_2_2]|nr:hypothetical protein [Microcoleus sp. SU_5_3]NJS12674.1 hypothetical protein [Microcoleus sp. CSU_2_2]